MADIQEIPVDIQPVQQDGPEELVSMQETPEEAKVLSLPPQPRAKGRPKGAKNKAPAKPRAKKRVAAQEIPEESETREAYSPSSPRRNLEIPQFGVNEVAVEMLKLLSNQQQARQQRKRDLYKSWFS